MLPKRKPVGTLAAMDQNLLGTGGGCVPMVPSTRVRWTQPGRAKAPSMAHSERDFRPNRFGAPEPNRRLAAQDGCTT